MHRIKISVVIPVYNKASLLKTCIESILSQDIADINIIAVDDASTDESVSVLSELATFDNRVKVIRSKDNMGPMWARMLGYSEADGDFVVFCDADDYFPKGALAKLYDNAVKSRSDIVIGNIQLISANGEEDKTNNQLPFGNTKDGIYRALLNKKLSQSLCGKIFRRELFDADLYAEPNQKNGEDGWLLYQLISKANKVSLIQDTVYCYIMDEASTTHQRYSDEVLKRVIKSNVERVKIAMEYPNMRKYASRHLIINMTQWLYDGYSSTLILDTYQKIGGDKTLIAFKSLISFFSYREILKIVTKILYGKIRFRN